MAKYMMLATSAAQAGQEQAFNEWYDSVHIPDVCAIPGVKSAKRLEADASTPAKAPYMTIYDIETDDPGTVLAEIGKRVGSGEMKMSPALDPSNSGITMYKLY